MYTNQTIHYFRVLQLFHVSPDEYSVIFTSGATAAMKLLVDSFDFSTHSSRKSPVQHQDNEQPVNKSYLGTQPANRTDLCTQPTNSIDSGRQPANGIDCNTQRRHEQMHASADYDTDALLSPDSKRMGQEHMCTHNAILPLDRSDVSMFVYLDDSHTSVVGMREVACARGAQFACMNPAQVEQALASAVPHSYGAHPTNHLFAFPAQSNFSGTKYPLSWICRVQETGLARPGHWCILLDAAGFSSTSCLDLSVHKPHFVAVSFYKLLGFPTGLGELMYHSIHPVCMHA